MTSGASRLHKLLCFGLNSIIILVMVLSVGVGMGQASTLKNAPQNVQVDPYIYVSLEESGTARVLVILSEQADLTPAVNLQTKLDKGTFVYQRLTEVANRTQGPISTFLDSKGVVYRAYWIQNMFMVDVDLRLLQELAKQPGIAQINLYHPPYLDVMRDDLGPGYGTQFGPLPPAGASQAGSPSIIDQLQRPGPQQAGSPQAVEWNIMRVNADDAWGIGVTGTGAVVGDLDTGVQWDHPALKNQYRGWNGATADHNYNWYDGGMTLVPTDYDGHGTHTMGTIVGDDGGTNKIGMAPGARWIACPGIGSPYVGPFECFEFFLAPTDLYGNNPNPALAPHVISNSWSSAGTNFHPAIQALYAAGIFFSKSAGNTGSGCSTITNPGQWPEVTATAAFAQGDTIAGFSSRGPILFGHDYVMKPDIAAPGVNVRSSYPGNGYTSMQGTSMACPHVTGAVALLISANPNLAGRIDILQMLLKQNAEPKINAQCAPFVDHPNDVWGWGILNAYAAVLAAQAVEVGNIEGVVTDASTLAPIPGAALTFSDPVTQWNFSSVSQPDGSYLRDLPAATYDVTAGHYGYLDTTIPNVDVLAGATVIQDLALIAAPVWVVSGVVTDAQTQTPLEASIAFEQTPVLVQTDPATGQYTADVAQGTWWMDVSSPGHTPQSLQLVVDQSRTANFSLNPIYNYYMHRSVDGACGPTFNWIDAIPGGTPRPLSDDSYVLVTLPGPFTFYGSTYTNLYIGSNGIADFTLDSGTSKWSGPIPDPAAPNNGIYAFSQDLNPANGSQGNIYTKYVDGRYYVIEWYQVQHYPSGNPETFEIILDMATNVVTIQYLVVSDPTTVVAGVENATGSEATQYAYGDPNLLANNRAVTFYPQFGTPPPTGVAGGMTGTVTDAQSHTPLQSATVAAQAYSTGAVYTFTTDVNGQYSAALCADWYSTSASAAGYTPVLDVPITIHAAEQVVQDYALQPICDACTNVDFSWLPVAPIQAQDVVFTAVASGTLPINFTWDFGDGATGQGQQVTHMFIEPGTYTVTLTVDNCAGSPVVVHYQVTVLPLTRYFFLPLAIK